MRILYSFFLYLLLPVVLARLFLLGFRNRGYWHRWYERFGFIAPAAGAEEVVWIHAVSVGEVTAAAPFVRAFSERFPTLELILSTTTPTGAVRAEQQFGDGIRRCYLPYDFPDAVARFVSRIKPRLLILVETELWPNLLSHCHRRRIPVVVINARLSARSYRGYRRFRALSRGMLARLSLVAAQTEADAERFRALAPPELTVEVVGNLKFDARVPPEALRQARALRRRLGAAYPLWAAGSTHAGEEERLLDAHALVSRRFPESKLVLAPRHPERFAEVLALCRQRGLRTSRYTDLNDDNAALQVLVIDEMGVLLTVYGAVDVVFVGGSLVDIGGHNMLEPALMGRPVLTGPSIRNFQQIYQLLRTVDAARIVENGDALAGGVCAYFADPERAAAAGRRGRAIVAENRGASARAAALAGGFLTKLPAGEPHA